VSFYRPTGRLAPDPAALAYASVELAALEYQARRGEIIWLYADETLVWRFALPRAGWWRKAPRARLPIRPLSRSQIRREESLQTARVGTLSLLEPGDEWRVAQCDWCRPIWHLESLL
jgi:hypothetical protein